MKNKLLKRVVFVLLLCAGSYASAIGTTFLTIPGNPRELALGGLTSSLSGDPSLARGNPALIVQSYPALEIYFGYNSWLAGAKGSSVLVAQPLLQGTLGVGIRNMNISDLEFRSSIPSDESVANFMVSGTAVEGIWGRQFDRLRLGGTMRWIRIESYIYQSSGYSVDFGAWWPVLRDRISIGTSVQNLGSMSPLLVEKPSLPVMFQTGATFNLSSGSSRENSHFHSILNVGAEISDIHGVVSRVAGEISFGEVRITLGSRMSEKVTEVAGGASLRWRRLQVSYALSVGSHNLGIPHLFFIKTTLP